MISLSHLSNLALLIVQLPPAKKWGIIMSKPSHTVQMLHWNFSVGDEFVFTTWGVLVGVVVPGFNRHHGRHHLRVLYHDTFQHSKDKKKSLRYSFNKQCFLLVCETSIPRNQDDPPLHAQCTFVENIKIPPYLQERRPKWRSRYSNFIVLHWILSRFKKKSVIQ